MVLNRNAKHKRSSREIDAKYVAQGRALAVKYDDSWEDELKEMNRGKVGRPFQYSHSMMFFVAMCRVMIDTGYRQCSGYFKETWGDELAPSYSTIWQRAGKTMPRFKKDSTFQPPKDGIIRLVPDSTGMKIGNRGEWIRVKWKVNRGFFKLHILVDLDTRRILAFSITDVNGGDGHHLFGLLKDVLAKYTGGVSLPEPIVDLVIDAMPKGALRSDDKQTLMDQWLNQDKEKKDKVESESKSPKPNISRTRTDTDDSKYKEVADKLLDLKKTLEDMGLQIEVRGDGGYDTREVFSYLSKLGITPIVKVRVNSNTSSKGVDRSRTMVVLDQLGGKGGCTNYELHRMRKYERLVNQKEWKSDVRYGLRWLVEIVISAFKRVFGESVRARTPYTAYVEIATKIAAYNRNLDIGDMAIQALGGGTNDNSNENLASIKALDRWIAA